MQRIKKNSSKYFNLKEVKHNSTLLQSVHSHFFPKRQYGKDGGVAVGSGQLYSQTN